MGVLAELDLSALLDLPALYDKLNAIVEHAGRSPVGPAILLALWLQAGCFATVA